MRRAPLFLALFAVGCFEAPDPEDTQEPADTDTDTDADSDTDTDADSDTDTDVLELLPAWTNDLANAGGCSDVLMYAWKPDDTVALFFRGSGVAEAAHAAGEATEFYWALPHPDVEVWAERGEHLTHVTCNDVMEVEPVVAATWTATSGSVFLTVTPTGDHKPWGEYPALGELELSGIILEPEHGGNPAHVSYFPIAVGIGWMPG